MSVETIRPVPTDLPHADIYLDDLFEIEDLLTAELRALGAAPETHFEYEVDDLRMTAREDLEKHGGSTSRFSLMVVFKDRRWKESVLQIHGGLRPHFTPPHDLGDRRYELFGRAQQIFNGRASEFKAAMERILDSRYAYTTLCILGVAATSLGAFYFDSTRRFLELGATCFLFYAALAALAFAGATRKNRLILEYVRQNTKARKEKRSEAATKVWIGILCATVGAFVGALLQRMLR